MRKEYFGFNEKEWSDEEWLQVLDALLFRSQSR
jgi:hypothetical protein